MTQEPRPTPELLPCPFCGGQASIVDNNGHAPCWVTCEECDVDGPSSDRTMLDFDSGLRQSAATNWNRRTVKSLTPDQVERAMVLVTKHDHNVYGPNTWRDAIELLREVVGE